MAKSHYNADSASFPSHSLHRGMPAAGDENPVKTADFPALAVDHASPSPATCKPALDTRGYLGAIGHVGRRLPERPIIAGTDLSGPSPTTAVSIN